MARWIEGRFLGLGSATFCGYGGEVGEERGGEAMMLKEEAS